MTEVLPYWSELKDPPESILTACSGNCLRHFSLVENTDVPTRVKHNAPPNVLQLRLETISRLHPNISIFTMAMKEGHLEEKDFEQTGGAFPQLEILKVVNGSFGEVVV